MKKPKFIIDEDGRIRPVDQLVNRAADTWGGTLYQALREIGQTGNQFCSEIDQTARNTLNEIGGPKRK